MLTRRDIRIKVMQALYAFYLSENNRPDQGEKQLADSLEKIYQLYIRQLSFLDEVVKFAEKRIDENRQKLLPTPEDLNPNTRFVENKIIDSLRANRDYQNFSEKIRINWSLQEEMIRKFYNELRSTDEFRKYMEKASVTFDDDRELLLFMVRNMMVSFEILQYHYEEMNIHWVDDYDTVLQMLERTLKGWKEKQDPTTHLPALYKQVLEGEDDDYRFAMDLFRKVLLHSSKYDAIIEKKISNWEFDRVAKVDILLLRMAVCEFLEFPTIPVKVTINEYIDISKIFSSPKSKLFINGMLDKLALHFREEGTLKKSGRGLIDN
ncbi:MAG TPA: transcription antitermination factor NusB [Bacteroidales bacterium]|nr:transcription antitermination factor NusB [Bacteroidales bacterium]HRZ49323.1 transcription antitermination factor NusB [Bacteroidales bacterium]